MEVSVLFAVIALVAPVSDSDSPSILLGAQVFFVSLLLFIPVFDAGIKDLRAAVRAAGIAGLALRISGIL